MKNNCIAFTGGGTGGHIYPGLAVADSLRQKTRGGIRIVWLGSRGKMDKDIVQNAKSGDAQNSVDKFYGIPSGKLRRYFSFKNFIDFFKIGFGFIAAFFILLKERPAFLFSKGGFVSVPPCIAARLLGIKVYTHECDFTPGLATKINAKFAHRILLSYEETKNYFKNLPPEKFVVTGNPVRPVFYEVRGQGSGVRSQETGVGGGAASVSCVLYPESCECGGAASVSCVLYPESCECGGAAPVPCALYPASCEHSEHPLLLVTGGSLGAAQINELVVQNIEWLCEHFVVIHQTGRSAAQMPQTVSEAVRQNYHPYEFIYAEMPHVFAAADVVLCRAGANSIWEAAVLQKPMVLLPLEGAGTRGDQVDNAEFFEKNGAAIVIRKSDANSENLKKALSQLLQKDERQKFSAACKKITGSEKPAQKIADILYNENLASKEGV